MRDLPRALAEALQFLTRLPLPLRPATRGPGAAAAAFPLAGSLLGLLVALIDFGLRHTVLPPLTIAIILVVALVVLSGGLHLDGLMDTCDGLGGGHTPEQRLEIMRDSRVGSYGVLGGACALLLKFGAIAALPASARTEALIVAPALARWSIVLAAALYRPARAGGLGSAFRAELTPDRLAVAAATGIVIGFAAGHVVGLSAWLLCGAATWLLGRAISSQIGGLTGDAYGAIAELSEIIALYVFALLG